MKLVKMSLATIIALGSSAYALEDIKVDATAKLWYQTKDVDGADKGFFEQGASSGQASIEATITGKVSGSTGYGLGLTVLDTLGLENNLVSNVAASLGTNAEGLNTQWWAREAYITHKFGSTLAKVGRQELDTPLAFTEKWNVVSNTFDAAVLVNSSIPNTTLIGAYVGKGNGGNLVDGFAGGNTVVVDGQFSNYVNSGAYAFAALNNSIKNLPINLWYYNVDKVATAIWADTKTKVGMANICFQYGSMDPKASGAETTDAFGLKVSGDMNNINLSLAYTSVSEGVLAMANTATGFKKTKLFTATVFSDGTVAAQPDTNSFKLAAKSKFGPVALTGQFGSYDVSGDDVTEFDVIASTKINDINLKGIYLNQSDDRAGKSDQSAIRIVASVNF